MAASMPPLPGTSDIWPPEIKGWVFLENTARDIFSRYAYSELRTPVFERTDVFVRGLGDETEVVQKEMYTFKDRGNRSLTLRPEGTAGVMRAIAHKGLSQGEEKRVFYMGPMFRGERPAAGRKRQFHQIGVEAVGTISPGMDVECIAMLVQYLDAVGLGNSRVMINSRGTAEDRAAVSAALTEYFRPEIGNMCEDCQRRIDTNVWRMMDCKDAKCQDIINGAPAIVSLLSESSQEYFNTVVAGLDAIGVKYEVNPRLVRGLDYYEHTIFEVVHEGLGAQDALAGGGRYKITLPGNKKPVEGVGFAMGMERLLISRDSMNLSDNEETGPEVYVAAIGQDSIHSGLALAQELRQSKMEVVAELTGRSMKAQMRNANRLNAHMVLILGQDEIEQGVVSVRDMKTSEQAEVKLSEIKEYLENIFNKA